MVRAGDVKFQIEFCPKDYGDEIHERGEWPGDYMKVVSTNDFQAAEKFAIEKAKSDYFGCASIVRKECENPKYDWWDQTGFWEVMPTTKVGDLDPEAPDH